MKNKLPYIINTEEPFL